MPAASLDVGPDGRVGVVWTSGHEDEARDVFFAESVDGGISYGANRRVHPSPTGIQQQPTVAYDGAGTVHACWEDAQPPSWDYDIQHAGSADGGATFSAPRRVNDDPVGTGYGQEKVHVAGFPDGGAVAVWIDARESGDENVYLASTQAAAAIGTGDPGAGTRGDRRQRPPGVSGVPLVYPNPLSSAAWIRAPLAVIYDARGHLVRRLDRGTRPTPATLAPDFGAMEAFWDGRDARGVPVPAGLYLVCVELASGWRATRVTVLR